MGDMADHILDQIIDELVDENYEDESEYDITPLKRRIKMSEKMHCDFCDKVIINGVYKVTIDYKHYSATGDYCEACFLNGNAVEDIRRYFAQQERADEKENEDDSK
jgi:late competence protein required for DNA uptake (superfamily II DNA/RNA helicase)